MNKYSTEVGLGISGTFSSDAIVRVRERDGMFTASVIDTNSFLMSFRTIIDTLIQTVRGLQEQLEYHGLHTAYLLGQYDEGEFEESAKKYAFCADTVANSELASKLAIIARYCDLDISAMDLAHIFKVSDDSIQEAMKSLQPAQARFSESMRGQGWLTPAPASQSRVSGLMFPVDNSPPSHHKLTQ